MSIPAVLLYVIAAEPLLIAIFGQQYADGAGALPVLAIAMSLLACAYLSVQYLLALERANFLWALAVAAVAEPLLLQGIGSALLDTLLARAREAGYPSISLSVDRNNGGAIELYERHGFERVGEDADSLTMLAHLEPTTPTNEGTDTA